MEGTQVIYRVAHVEGFVTVLAQSLHSMSQAPSAWCRCIAIADDDFAGQKIVDLIEFGEVGR